nr:MAG TPA: hypothetical protein [Caudoviricetes sp.]
MSQTIESNTVRGTLVLRSIQKRHRFDIDPSQVSPRLDPGGVERGPENRLWKPRFTCQIGVILRENRALYAHLTARAISRPPSERIERWITTRPP